MQKAVSMEAAFFDAQKLNYGVGAVSGVRVVDNAAAS